MPKRTGRPGPGRGKRRTREPEITTEDIARYIQKAEGRSANIRRILSDFDASPRAQRQIKEILTQLVKDGRLARHKGHRYEAAQSRNLVQGTLLVHRDGYGFVIPKEKVEGVQSDVFIPPPLIGGGMNGDKVEVEITFRKAGGRAEGRVVRVTKRARDTIVGQLRFDGAAFFVAPADRNLPPKILITADASEHKDKIVEVEITRFASEGRWPEGKVIAAIGFLDDPKVETTVIMRKYGLPSAFPKEVEDEAASLPDGLTAADLEGRSDFRQRSTLTIDPTTARDFDDAIDIEILEDGTYQLGVHIADVSHFVRPNSAMDLEARFRGTSVYFPDRVLPMLPEKVSNELCSLKPRTDRLALSVIAHISRDGVVRDYSFHQSIIHSRERLNYDEVQKLIDNDPADSSATALRTRFAHILPEIEKLGTLARVLQGIRQERGAIDFDLPEPMLAYDDQGEVTGIVKSERHFSHRIIEEFMILANEIVARHVERLEIPAIYRVHERPDPAKVMEFTEIVSGFGLAFRPRNPSPGAFQKFIASIAGRPEERMLSYLMLRSFKQAVYATDNIGHFGLASNAYTHFTSPIRRYPDLVIHRILKAAISRKSQPPMPPAQLDAIASESSDRERTAARAERDLFDWKKLNLLEKRLGDTFEAIIIAVWKDGFAIELVEQFIEGFVAAVDIPGDYFRLDPVLRAMVGKKSNTRFRLGDRLPVQVARVDKLLNRAYFVPALPIESRPNAVTRTKPRRGR